MGAILALRDLTSIDGSDWKEHFVESTKSRAGSRAEAGPGRPPSLRPPSQSGPPPTTALSHDSCTDSYPGLTALRPSSSWSALFVEVPQGKRTDRISEAIAALHGAEAVDVAWAEKKAAK